MELSFKVISNKESNIIVKNILSTLIILIIEQLKISQIQIESTKE